MTDSVATRTQDVRRLINKLLDGVMRVPMGQWDEQAGRLAWTRWETAEHLADDLFVYAATLAAPSYPADLPFETTRRRVGAPDELVHSKRAAGPQGIAAVIGSASNLLIAIAEATPPHVTADHVYGRTGAEGFAAMACVEVIVHGHDIFSGTEVEWAPDEALCSRTVARLFPDVAGTLTAGSYSELLWATGRIQLPGSPYRSEWRWHNQVLGA